MRVLSVDGRRARCEAKGSERVVDLFLLQTDDVRPGDHVLVHAGNAIEKMSEAEAAAAWVLFDEILAALEPSDDHAASHTSSSGVPPPDRPARS